MSNFKFLKTLLYIIIPVFLIHISVFQIPFFKEGNTTFHYSIPLLYLIYFSFSVITLFILSLIAKKSFENIGFAFLFLSSSQIGLSYLLIQPILESTSNNAIEKWNFFLIMFLFIAIQSILTVRILNKKY